MVSELVGVSGAEPDELEGAGEAGEDAVDVSAAQAVSDTSRASDPAARRDRGTEALYGPVMADEQQHDQHEHGHDHHQAPGDRDWAEFGARLQLEGDVAMPVIADAIARLAAVAQDTGLEIDRILDVGSGPGVAAIALAAAFPGVSAVAVDASAPLLELVADRAIAHGVGDRVHTQVADLEQSLGELGAADVVWASMVLHHVAAPGDTLRRLHDLLRPGGLLAIVEFGSTRSTLPVGFDVGEGNGAAGAEAGGFVARHAAAVHDAVAAHLPPGAMTIDWPLLLADAGFTLLEQGEIAMHLPAPLGEVERRFVLQGLQMSLRMVAERLDAADIDTLEALASEDGPRSVLGRDDLSLDVTRAFFLARRA